MNRLIERTVSQGIMQHLGNPTRVYSEDPVQKDRILRTILCATTAMPAGGSRLIEIGCGTADISGSLAVLHSWHATGIDCHAGALLEAHLRYGNRFSGFQGTIMVPPSGPLVDLVILAEVLEHLDDPKAVAGGWLKRARASVISHPLNEPLGSVLSGGDHAWSFSEEDHREFFHLGGHVIDDTQTFAVGLFTIILSRGHRGT